MPRFRSLLILFLCLPLLGCFEEPVREHLHLTLRGGGPVIVTVVQEVTSSDDRLGDNPALDDRLEESRDTINQNLDPWSQRFALLDPLAEHISIERVDGELRRSIHSGVLAFASRPRRYFRPPEPAFNSCILGRGFYGLPGSVSF